MFIDLFIQQTFSLSLFFFFLLLLRADLRHMEVSRLGVKLELKLPATASATWDLSRACSLHHSSQQCWIPNLLSKARILMDAS